jgi:hypothetical protein
VNTSTLFIAISSQYAVLIELFQYSKDAFAVSQPFIIAKASTLSDI